MNYTVATCQENLISFSRAKRRLSLCMGASGICMNAAMEESSPPRTGDFGETREKAIERGIGEIDAL
jgi:hypothetical protein